MENLIKDISILSTIPQDSLEKITNYANYCICDYVVELLDNSDDDTIVIDIGIGSLSLILEDNAVRYRFVPSKTLEDNIVKTIIEEENPLVAKLEKNLSKRITAIYKELL